MRILVFVVMLCCAFVSRAQENLDSNQTEAELLFYADVMINAAEVSSRQLASEKFNQLFESYIHNNKGVQEDATFRKYISILPSPDNNFNLISWMVQLENGQSNYFGYLTSDKQVIKLNQTEKLTKDVAYMTSTSEDWYGCLYYNILKHDKNQYLIFGKDYGNYDNSKIIDVLTVEDNGFSFGAPLFEDPQEPGTFANRILISYSSDASVVLKYHPGLDLIIHDHLQTRMGQQPGQGPTNIPDGTYEGYEKKGQKWMYKEKIFTHKYEENKPPRPKPLFKDGDTDKSKLR